MPTNDVTEHLESSQSKPPAEIAPYAADWSLFARRTAAVFLLLTLLFTASLVGPVVQNTILALILAFILLYPIRVLTQHTRLTYKLAVLLVLLLYLALAILIIGNVTSPVANFIRTAAVALQIGLTEFITFLENYTPGQGWLVDVATGEKIVNLNFILEPLSQWVQGQNLQELANVLANFLVAFTATTGTIGNFLVNAFVVHVLAIVFLLEIPHGFRWFFSILPATHRREYALLFTRMSAMWVAYFRGTVTAAGLTGLLVWVALTLLGIRNATIVAISAGLLSLLPVVGGFIAFPVVGLNAFLAGSTVLDLNPLLLTVLVLVIYLLIGTAVWNIIYPRLAGNAVALPMSIVILGLIIGGALGGVLGIFLAAPVLGIIRQVVEYVLKKIRGGDPYPGEPEPPFLSGLLS